jgi:hypothetical protein
VEFKRDNHTFEETKAIFKMARSTFYEWEKEYDADFPEKQELTYEKKSTEKKSTKRRYSRR